MERGLRGHLRLVCARNGAGDSILREQSFSAPVHVGKSFQENGCCLLHVMNPAAGFLAGDRMSWDVEVREGARLILSGPGASRAHTMRSGQAIFSQHFQIEAGGWLEVSPSLFIPQRGTRYRQETRIELAQTAGLFFLETLAPGRVASGESFAFDTLAWDTQVKWGGRLILKERYRLQPVGMSLRALRTLWDPSYYAALLAIHPKIDPAKMRERVSLLEDDSVVVAASTLRQGGVMMKILSRCSPSLHRTLEKLRTMIYEEAELPRPLLRR